MADKVLEKIRRNYTNLRTAFRALDRSNNGYISRADFLDALEHIFINSGCTPEDVKRMHAYMRGCKRYDVYATCCMYMLQWIYDII